MINKVLFPLSSTDTCNEQEYKETMTEWKEAHLSKGKPQETWNPDLISMGMATNDNGFLPAWHKARNVVADDGFSEHCAAQDVADGAIGRLPHLLEVEL